MTVAQVVNVGSLNIDHVYQVPHIVRPGETLSGDGYEVFPGGKGANQSAALARAGARVRHVGRIGQDGGWLRDELAHLGVDVTGILVDEAVPTGHAVIQVEAESAENAIFLYAGANHRLCVDDVLATCDDEAPGLVLLQNEISDIEPILRALADLSIPACLNPAPFTDDVLDWPLDTLDLLVVNRTEAAGLTGQNATEEPDVLLTALKRRWPDVDLLLTLGADGAVLQSANGRFHQGAVAPGPAVDTTAAGDTFIGFFLARRLAGDAPAACLRIAATAAGIAVTRPGAQPSIPDINEVQKVLGE